MRENKGFCSFAFDSAHVKYGVWTWPDYQVFPPLVSQFVCYCSHWSYESYQDYPKQLQMTRNNLRCQDLSQYRCTSCRLCPNHSIFFRLKCQVRIQNSENSQILFRNINIDKQTLYIFNKLLLLMRKNLKCQFVDQERGALCTTWLKAHFRIKVQSSLFRQ